MSLNFTKDVNKITILGSVKKASHTYGEVLLMIIVAGLFYGFLARPKAAELAGQKQTLGQLQNEYQALDGNLNALNELIDKLKAGKKTGEIEKLDEAIPLDGKVFSFNNLLKILAKESGVTLGSFLISGTTGYIIAGNTPLLEQPFGQKRSLQKLPGDITAIGNLEQIINFIKKIEDSARIIQINSLEISGSQEDGVSLHMNIETYYYE